MKSRIGSPNCQVMGWKRSDNWPLLPPTRRAQDFKNMVHLGSLGTSDKVSRTQSLFKKSVKFFDSFIKLVMFELSIFQKINDLTRPDLLPLLVLLMSTTTCYWYHFNNSASHFSYLRHLFSLFIFFPSFFLLVPAPLSFFLSFSFILSIQTVIFTFSSITVF